MKKAFVFIVLVITVLVFTPLFVQCSDEHVIRKEGNWSVQKFESHEYITYSKQSWYSRSVSITHSPDCPCHKLDSCNVEIR